VFKLLKMKRLKLKTRQQAVTIIRQKPSRKYGREHVLASENGDSSKSEILVSSPYKKEFENQKVSQVKKTSKHSIEHTTSQ
jgi:hypothetical protein